MDSHPQHPAARHSRHVDLDDGKLADTPVIATRVQAGVTQRLDALGTPSLLPFWVVLGIELVVFVVCKVVLPASIR